MSTRYCQYAIVNGDLAGKVEVTELIQNVDETFKFK